MLRRLMLFIPLALCVGLGVVLWLGLGQNPYQRDDAGLGRSLPALSAPDLLQPGQQIPLQSLRGQAFLLNVWASWCVNCRAEHEYLIQLASHIRLVGLNYRDKAESAHAWLAESGNPYQIVLFDGDGKLALELGVYTTPETWLYSAQGVLLARHSGVMTPEVWQRTFAPRLKEAAR